MTTKTNTKPINPDSIRHIESTSWGSGIQRGLRLHKAAQATRAVGLEWPAETVDTVDSIANALSRVAILNAERPRLTLDDLLADDAPERARAAITIDEGGTRRGTPAQQELSAAAIAGMNRAITTAAPDMLAKVADWLIEHRDERHMARAAHALPAHLRARLSAWNHAVTAHAELLNVTDPMGFEDLERNEEAHRLYSWTVPQWIEYHAEHDTLSQVKMTSMRWWDWPGLDNLTIDPARSVADLAKRVKAANDAGQAYNAEHRAKEHTW